MTKNARSVAQEMCTFLRDSVSPFHVVKSVREMLVAAGFVEIQEQFIAHKWKDVQRGGKYFTTRNESSIAAFVVGEHFQSDAGATVIVAHTDSPALILKPRCAIESNGMQQLGVQCYGGGLWHTWLDRDLSLAGRVILQERKAVGAKQNKKHRASLYSHLVNLEKPIAIIPNLAIHLQTAEEREKLSINKEKHLVPILMNLSSDNHSKSTCLPHALSDEILRSIHRSPDRYEIIDHELYLYDSNQAQLTGLKGEFLSSARLDNLASCYAATKALLQSKATLQRSRQAHIMVLFDNEEVGSNSFAGAEGNLLSNVIELLCEIGGSKSPANMTKQTFTAKSFCISADCGHAVHPNYADRHESQHMPQINGGITLKHNASMKYATRSLSSAIIRAIAAEAHIGLQDVVGRNDKPCGSTVGPIVSSQTGISTVDLGIPLWGMHSIRETCGVADVTDSINFFSQFYCRFFDIQSMHQACES